MNDNNSSERKGAWAPDLSGGEFFMVMPEGMTMEEFAQIVNELWKLVDENPLS